MTLKKALQLMDEMEKVLERTDPIPESLWGKYHTLVRSIIEGVLPKSNDRGFFTCNGKAYQIYMDLIHPMPPRPYYPKISPNYAIVATI